MAAIENLVELGKRLNSNPAMAEKAERAAAKNPWFIPQYVQYAINAIVNDMLNEGALRQWLNAYTLKPIDKTIGLIFAGNVPLVGFHDFLCCYLAGCKMKIKLSSKDDELFTCILDLLTEIDPRLKQRVEIVDRLKDFDAVIATGSDNTNRYFEQYFKAYPKVLRKSRNSVAILTGNETPDQLKALADDMFVFFGFGCRNVSKLYVPVGYTFDNFFPEMEAYKWMHNNTRYMNNYDYSRTVLLLNKTPHFANEFLMLVENPAIASAIATVNYEHWHDENLLKTHLKQSADKIQCVVSAEPQKWGFEWGAVFGQAQHPKLNDYADGVDTLQFLLGL